MKFDINSLQDSSVMMMYLERERIFLDPPYQRTSEVWNLDKKQLLIDSLINGFDIPKLYFHEYEKAEEHDHKLYKYAIIDGKQRLAAIWDFMDGKFALSKEIEYIKEPSIKLTGLDYEDLSREYPTIHARFTGRTLAVIAIRTDDTDLIEDMFSRLNEAVPLNAAEKRNAFGGPIPKMIRSLVKMPFFSHKLKVSTKRYRHHDLACKLLYLENQNGPSETKKIRLDQFVKDYSKKKLVKKAAALHERVMRTLEMMNQVFRIKDPLLRSPGTIVAYYLLFREQGVTRSGLEAFEEKLRENRELAEKNLAKADADLLEFDRLNQTPNDKSAIEYRLKVLKKFVS